VSEGSGLLTVKLIGEVVPPPGAAFTTVIARVPAVVRSAAVIVADSSVALTNAVARSVPPRFTSNRY
jgi:hypothetical protein